jgi:hypothetical protein
MSGDAFRLRVAAGPEFRDLANGVVDRYIELSGGTAAERGAFAAALTEAIDGLVTGTDEAIDLVCTTRPSGFDMTVRCGSRSVVVRHPLPAGTS